MKKVMGIPQALATITLACAIHGAALAGAPLVFPSQQAEVKLAYGSNDVKAGPLTLRIMRAQVGTLSASDFDTYTVYLVPANASEPWLHVTMPASKGIGYQLRNYETADANTQAIAFYRTGNRLYAVQASKVGPQADASGSARTAFDIKVFVFNDNDEVPMFDDDGGMRTKQHYVDAREALQHEFFKR